MLPRLKSPYLIMFLQLAIGYITYDQGRVNGNTGYSGSKSYTYTQTFSDSFKNIPQIYIQPRQISLGSAIPGEIDMDIISLTLIDFQVTINCPTSSYVGSYQFLWLAIDQAYVQILHPSKQSTVTNGTTYTHSHTLSQATQAIVILDSFRFVSGGIDFYLLVTQVTDANVTIQLITNTNNLEKVGYSVVVGTKEAFFTTALVTTGSGNDTLGSYSVKALQNSLFYCPPAGFGWSGSNSIRFNTSNLLVDSNYSYFYQAYSGTIMKQVTLQSIQFSLKQFFHIMLENLDHQNNISKVQQIKWLLSHLLNQIPNIIPILFKLFQFHLLRWNQQLKQKYYYKWARSYRVSFQNVMNVEPIINIQQAIIIYVKLIIQNMKLHYFNPLQLQHQQNSK